MENGTTPYHEIVGTAVETFKLGWEALGKLVAKFHYHQEQLPPPPPDSERSMRDY